MGTNTPGDREDETVYEDTDDEAGVRRDRDVTGSPDDYGEDRDLYYEDEGEVREEYTERPGDEGARGGTFRGDYWGLSLGALLLAVGIVLFVIPEPATSTLGILLAAVGAVVLVAGAAS